jgi:predicted nucleic acid-binding protein
MPFVVDASITLAWAFDEVHPKAVLARERLRTDEALVPSLWWFELRNALVMGERRGRLTERDTAFFLRSIGRLAVGVDRVPDETAVLTLARRHRLTVYDAAYLELALRETLPLATLDGALAGAAQAERVPLIGDGAEPPRPRRRQ